MNFKVETLLTLKVKATKNQKKNVLRVVLYNSKWPKLEHREVYICEETGEEKVGKSRGLGREEIECINLNYHQIMDQFKRFEH